MEDHHKINYIEIPAKDIQKTQAFYNTVFSWQFTDYGPEYCSVDNGGIDAGFYLSKNQALVENGSVLVVLYSDNLTLTMGRIKEQGGSITKDIFAFPGGERFHFLDPNRNELAVWCRR